MKAKYLLPLMGLGLVFTACEDTSVAASSESTYVFCDKVYAEGAVKNSNKGSYQYEYTCKAGKWELTDSTRYVGAADDDEDDEEEERIFCDDLYASGAKKLELKESSIYEYTCSRKGNWKASDTINIEPIIKSIVDTLTVRDTVKNTIVEKDTIVQKDTVIKRDTVVKKDTVTQIKRDTVTVKEPQKIELCDDLYAPGAVKKEFDGATIKTYTCTEAIQWKFTSSEDVAVPPTSSSSAEASDDNQPTSSTSSSSIEQGEDEQNSSSSAPSNGVYESTRPQNLMYWSGSQAMYSVKIEGAALVNDNAGYWWSFNDADDDGESQIIYPVELGNEFDDSAIDPVIDECGGLCGSYKLEPSALQFSYTGVGFNVAGTDDDGAIAFDATDWNGICVTYTSDAKISLLLIPSDERYANLGYDTPLVFLTQSSTPVKRCFDWDDFRQEGWSDVKTTGKEIAQELVSIRFRFSASNLTETKAGNFNILAISSNDNRALTWSGERKDYRVTTGLDAGGDQSGYWYFFNDAEEGGESKIVFPIELGNGYDDNAIDPLVDEYAGIYGTVSIQKGNANYPYAGLGFNIAGTTDDESPDIETADATDLGGVCVTYSSERPFNLIMTLSDVKAQQVGYDEPFIKFPATTSVKTYCATWDSFAQQGWGKIKISGTEAAKELVALKIRYEGLLDGATGKFLIKEFYSINY